MSTQPWWLDIHAGSAMAITTVVLVATTIWYAWLVRKQLREMQETRELAAVPMLVCEVVPSERRRPAQDLLVANIGNGPARNIHCQLASPEGVSPWPALITFDAAPGASHAEQGPRVVRALGAGREARVPLGEHGATTGRMPEPVLVTVVLTYENTHGHRLFTRSPFRVGYRAGELDGTKVNLWTPLSDSFGGVAARAPRPWWRFWRRGP